MLNQRPSVGHPFGAVNTAATKGEVLAQGKKKRALVVDDEDALTDDVHGMAHLIGSDEARQGQGACHV